MSEELVCWKCGAGLRDEPLPLGRRSECLACRAELHVCRLCRHFAPGKAKQCREPMAEEVKDKVRANFCEWFQPRLDAYQPVAAAKPQGRSALEGLFGDALEESPDTGPGTELDKLFGK